MSTSTLNPDTTKIDRLLQEGIQAARNRQRKQAHRLLMRVVTLDQNNIQGWLWLSGVVDSTEDRQICLENVLALDPKNPFAQKGLTMLRQKALALPETEPAAPESSAAPPPQKSGRYKRLEPAAAKQAATTSRKRIVLAQRANGQPDQADAVQPAASPGPDEPRRNETSTLNKILLWLRKML